MCHCLEHISFKFGKQGGGGGGAEVVPVFPVCLAVARQALVARRRVVTSDRLSVLPLLMSSQERAQEEAETGGLEVENTLQVHPDTLNPRWGKLKESDPESAGADPRGPTPSEEEEAAAGGRPQTTSGAEEVNTEGQQEEANEAEGKEVACGTPQGPKAAEVTQDQDHPDVSLESRSPEREGEGNDGDIRSGQVKREPCPSPPSPSPSPTSPQQARDIFVGNLSLYTSEPRLREHFSRFGTVEDVRIMYHKDSNKSRRFGFVTFQHPGSIKLVFQQTRHFLDGKDLQV